MAGYEAGGIRSKENSRACKLIELSEPPHGSAPASFSVLLLTKLLKPLQETGGLRSFGKRLALCAHLFTIGGFAYLSPGEDCQGLSLGTYTKLDQPKHNSPALSVYWRVEGSLLDLTTVRPVAFFTWNAQTFLQRWVRRGLVFLMAVLRPILYATHRVFATRVVHSVLRGVSCDRLDLLGQEYFDYKLKPHLKPEGVRQLKAFVDSGASIVLVSQGLDHVMRPLAQHLGTKWMIANRLEFRDGIATGRLLGPVIRPRGLFARITGAGPDGRRDPERLVRDLDLRAREALDGAVIPTERGIPSLERPIVHFDGSRRQRALSVRSALKGKYILLIGVTGFIGKVWLANTLTDLPDVGRIYLLIRRQKGNPGQQRFER